MSANELIGEKMSHPSNKITTENLPDIYSYHNEEWKIPHYHDIRQYGKLLSIAVITNTPDCVDRSTALRKIREAVMFANAAVALAKEPWE